MLTYSQWPSLFNIFLRVFCFFCPAPVKVVTLAIDSDIRSSGGISPTVNTPYGPVIGFVYATSTGTKVEGFFGIPYAKAPIRELRFQKPVAPEKWKSALNASTFGFRCSTWPKQELQSEDCLTLNIIRPNPTNGNAALPVMVWIHGGDFITGSGRDYLKESYADRFIAAGIIVVSINYRLGAFGFLSTGNAFAPGNYGLWDQVQALTFIQKVLPSFGGDPKQVTVFGESSGGASVSWLTLRPETESLFSKAISMSGSAQAIWANTDGTVQSSRAVIKEIGCDKVEDLPKCLQRASEADIINATQTISRKDGEYDTGMLYDTPVISRWNPRLDQDFLHVDTFKAALENAPKRPQLIGLNSQESRYFAIRGVNRTSAKYMPITENDAKHYSRPDFVDVVTNVLGTENAFGQNAKAATKEIIDYYEHSCNYQHDFFLQSFVQLCSDIEFNVQALREAVAKAKAENNEIYVYEYSYADTDGRRNLVDGAFHGYDLWAILYGLKKEPKLAQEFVDVFVNFVKTGTPSTAHATAEPVNLTKSTNIPFLQVDVPQITVEPDLWSDRVAFWDALANKYGFDWPLGRKTE